MAPKPGVSSRPGVSSAPGAAGDSDGSAPSDPLADAAAELYAVEPAQFLTTRTELVRGAKGAGNSDVAKQITALRKPSVAAWAVNHLIRTDPEVVQRLLAIGEALRSAQTRLDATALRGLRSERETVLTEVVRAAVANAENAGQRLTAATTTEVRESAVAALASPDGAAAFGSGTLTRALSYSGFGEVDVADAVARTGTGVVLAVIRGGRSDSPSTEPATTRSTEPPPDAERLAARLEGERRQAELALARARRALEAAATRLEESREASERARERVAQLRAELATATAEDERHLVEVTDAVRARAAAQAQLDAADVAMQEIATRAGG